MNKNMKSTDYKTKHNLGYKKIGNRKTYIKKQNLIKKYKSIKNNNNNNYKSINNIKTNNIYNNKISTNLINCLYQNNEIYYINKFASNNHTKSKKTNNSIIINNYYYNNNKFPTIKTSDSNIIKRRNISYRTLYEREKDKSKFICTFRNKNNENYFHNISVRINKKKACANSESMKKIIIKEKPKTIDIIGNINSEKSINNNLVDSNIRRFNKNMNI